MPSVKVLCTLLSKMYYPVFIFEIKNFLNNQLPLVNFFIIVEMKEKCMKDIIKISEVFPVSAKRLFDAWLNSEEHSDYY